MQEKMSEIDIKDLFFQFAFIIKRELKLIIIFLITGILLGLAYASFSKKVYESKMVINSSLLTFSFTEEIFNNLNLLIHERNTKALSENLNLTSEIADKLVEFEAKSLIEDRINPLKEGEKNTLIIKAKTLDPNIFSQVQQSIINYFENNAFVKIRIEQRREYYRETIKKVNSEITDLEEFKTKLQKGEFLQNMKGNIMFDPTSVNSKILELTKENIGNRHALSLADNIQVINGFTAISQPVWPRKSISMFVGGVMGIAIAFTIVFTKIIVREVKLKESQVA